MENSTLALVAVRLKSSRLPYKALKDLAGEPVIVRLTERLSLSKEIDEVVWCTSTNPQDAPLLELASKHGIGCYRGSELNVLQRFLDVALARGAKTVVRITGDNPLSDPQMIDQMIHQHHEAQAEYTYTDALPRGTRCEVIEVSALIRCLELVEDPDASEYMTLMLRRPDHFKVLKVTPDHEVLVRPELRLTIDTPEDFAVVNSIYQSFEGAPPPLHEIIKWLDDHPEVRDLNQAIVPYWETAEVNVRLRGDH